MQFGEFLEALLVDFVGRERCGRRGACGPTVPRIAFGLRPHAGIGFRLLAQRIELCQLRFERRGDLVIDDFLRAASPHTGRFDLAHAQRLRERAAIGEHRILERRLHLCDCLVEKEVGRHDAESAGGLHPFKFAIEDSRDLGKAGDVIVDVLRIAQRLGRAEEPREIDIAADILDHDVGCVAPAPHRNVAIGKVHPLERLGERAFYDVEADLLVRGKAVLGIGACLFEGPAKGRLIICAALLARRAESPAPVGI